MINPIEHSRVKDAVNKYKVEPYVISADIYGSSNLAGRGGWTWYTGSSSWFYKAGIEYILGMKINKGILSMKPCIPKDWKEFKIRYVYKTSAYDITVKNPEGKESYDIRSFKVDGEEKEEKNVALFDDGKTHYIEILI